jgi:multidrug efflux pump subunit AcrB
MKRIVFTFGLISAFILSTMIVVTIPLCMNGMMDFEQSEVIGYSAMILAFSMVFLGIRTYREKQSGGVITFGRAFKVGILITLVTCAVYVVTWEILYWGFVPDFDQKFAEHTIQKSRESGASAVEIAKLEKQMAQFREWYKNPLLNAGITFMEIFPIGLIVTLVSAAILKRKSVPPAGAPSGAATRPA